MTDELLTVPALLRHHAAREPELSAVVQDDARITYGELDAATRSLAARLVAAGVNKRSRVGLLMPNGIEWVTLAYALMRVGAVLVPLSTLLKPPELAAQLRAASVSHLVVVRGHKGRDYVADLESVDPALLQLGVTRVRHACLPALRHIWIADELPDVAVPDELVGSLEDSVRPGDDLAVMFTSGSRGTPKGVVHTHANAIRAVASGLDARCVGPGERLYIPMPFFWMGGFGGGMLTTLVAGATLLSEAEPVPARTIAFLERERATLFRGWPDQGVRVAADPAFASADLSSLKPGSLDAVLPAHLRARPGARANLFGMTETFGPYCGSRLDVDLPDSARGSCGRPFDGVEVRILDPETGATVKPGGQGEIAVRGANVMRTIDGRLREQVFTRDGFYRTGDLGRVDADGYLFYGGRTDDMFKVSGATVYPTEVEAALRDLPEVAQAYVTNIGSGAHAVVGAAVLLREPVSLAEIEAGARARLSSFKVPKRWVLLGSAADVPVMATGKVDKAGLQALIGGRRDLRL